VIGGPGVLRALVVDDSPLYRSLVKRCLGEIPGVEWLAAAGDAREALELAGRMPLDVILLDVDMPGLDGVEAIPGLRAAAPGAAIVMVSSLTQRGADVALAALAAGAFECVAKPMLRAGEDGFAILRADLARALAAVRQRNAPLPSALLPPPGPAGKPPSIELVAIGCSTGGPTALGALLGALPRDLPVPVLIAQHMAAGLTGSLARWLAGRSALPVSEAQPFAPLRRGEVLLGPGGAHLRVERAGTGARVQLCPAPPPELAPSVDALFESAARSFDGAVLGVVLTGMGSDGLRGAGAVRRAGGWAIAQDRASAAVYGMPRALVEAGEADEVLALAALAARIEAIAEGTGAR
jgi:two-component system chemotaxis response regulator CheB